MNHRYLALLPLAGLFLGATSVTAAPVTYQLKQWGHYLAQTHLQGSITVDGVSLTVNEVDDDVFGVNLIPHTWDVTTFAGLTAGTAVNIEIDTLARYLKRMQDVMAG